MPAAYSIDLKWQIVYLYHNNGFSKKQIAQTLYISTYTVKKVLRIYKKWGCVVDPWLKKALKQLVTDKVDWYLDELVSEMKVLTGKHLHKSAKERNEILRGAFIAHMGTNYTPEQLVFLDESAKDE
ncbi:homeodomain-like protein [Rhizophagus clarus]|uniref:Homeodomain-like protein n=1 Tax=Rhizophagus clarus TaxID=94130 RepID=A0A8H3M7X6_9GLOM|nr:homeodomain-like protein [Rhizophagus clarus]